MLDDEAITAPDRVRLLILFLLHKDGLVPADLEKLLAHAQLTSHDRQVMENLAILGVRTARGLREKRLPREPLFPRKPPPPSAQEEYLLSRFEPALQGLLEAHATGNVDMETFAYTKPPLESELDTAQLNATSLRSAKPTWAKTRANVSNEGKQRVIVFIAGGATFSEARTCYETGKNVNRDVFLATSHMQTPQLFMRQVGDLTSDRRSLGIPAEQPQPQAPAHLFEPDEQPKPPPPPQHAVQSQNTVRGPQPPTKLDAMNIGNYQNGARPPQPSGTQQTATNKLSKEPDKEKKKHRFGFGSKKDKS